MDKPAMKSGNELYMNGNYIPIEYVGKQYEKGGENNE